MACSIALAPKKLNNIIHVCSLDTSSNELHRYYSRHILFSENPKLPNINKFSELNKAKAMKLMTRCPD